VNTIYAGGTGPDRPPDILAAGSQRNQRRSRQLRYVATNFN